MNGATKISTPNHTDPYYTDVCYEITREMCDFCCLIDFEFCTRDIGICEPVEFRKLEAVVECVRILGGILLGFPVLINCLNCFLSFRCCRGYFETTGGVSCYECIMRVITYLFCCGTLFSDSRKNKEEEIVGDEEKVHHGVLWYLFCCCLCPCF